MFTPPKKLQAQPANDPNLLRARVWVQGAREFVYPEQAAGIVDRRKTLTGVAFSGGGNRAMVCAWGQLRALVETGLLDKVDYLSCVSGGSWAATAFTYYSSGPANDEEFLGRPTPPDRLRLRGLQQMAPFTLGAAATESFMSRLVEQAIFVSMRQITPNEVWLRAVGATFFDRFGLYDPARPGFVSWDDATTADILKRNPGLGDARFYTVRDRPGDAKRPYLVINATLMWPSAENFLHFEYAPLAAGSKQRLALDDGAGNQRRLGGGLLETFAYTAAAPAAWPPMTKGDCRGAGADGCVAVPRPDQPLSLTFASGTSSAAFAATNASLAGGNPMLNRYLQQGPPLQRYWPIPEAGDQAAPEADVYTFGDGGSLENFGLIPLLLRKVRNIVVFINTERRLDLSYEPSPENPPSIRQLDGNFSTLFGIPPSDRSQPPTPNNQVFRKEDFAPTIRALQKAQAAGGPAIATSELEVQPNAWWGLDGGWKATICWVYLDQVEAWEHRLEPELARAVAAGRRARPDETTPFWGFPNYKTMFQSGKMQIIAMTPAEANLLADFTCWTAMSSDRAALIRRTLRG